MAGLLDFLGLGGGSTGLFGGLFGPQPAAAGEAQQPPVKFVNPVDNGLFGRLGGSIGGFVNANNPVQGLFNAGKTLLTGEATDPQAIQQANMINTYRSLQKDFGLSEPQARQIVNSPQMMQEAAKALINPTTTVTPSGDILVQGAFGKLSVPGAVPISERGEVTNPGGSKSPAFFVKPSLTNQGGGVITPGQRVAGGAGGLGGGLITEQSPQATAEQKQSGDILANTYKGYLDSGVNATKKLTSLQRLSQLNEKTYQGAAAPTVQQIRSALSTFGFDPGKAPAGEEFTTFANRLVKDELGSLGQGISNGDVIFANNMEANLGQTTEGRKQIIQSAMLLAKRQQEVASMASEWKRKNNSIEGFSDYLAKWADEHPLFANRQSSQPKSPPIAPKNLSPQEVVTWARSKGLRSGQPIILPNGQQGIVP